MTKALFLPGALVFFASCTTFQYVTVNSSGVNKNDKQEFVVENDSLKLLYNFNGPDAPVNISVHNKLNVPMYIDWQRSAIIINDTAISYVPEKVEIQGNFGAVTSRPGTSHYGNYGYTPNYALTAGNFRATSDVAEQIAFVPPKTYISKTPLGITNQLIQNVPDSAYSKIKYVLVDGSTAKARKAIFTESTSPLKFRSYITIIVGEHEAKPVVLEHAFYVSELLVASWGPGSIWLSNVHRGNQFFLAGSSTPAGQYPPLPGKPGVSAAPSSGGSNGQ